MRGAVEPASASDRTASAASRLLDCAYFRSVEALCLVRPLSRQVLYRTCAVVIPEVKTLFSTDLDSGLPMDVEDCAVGVIADIGIQGQEGGDQFQFTVVTPQHLAKHDGIIWGRGYLIVPRFEWPAVEQALEKLLMHCRGEDWKSVANLIGRELYWEFEDYRPYNGAV